MYNLGEAAEGQDNHAYPRKIVTQPLTNREPYRNTEVNEIDDEGHDVDHGTVDQTLIERHVDGRR